jgi:hypothetical protein
MSRRRIRNHRSETGKREIQNQRLKRGRKRRRNIYKMEEHNLGKELFRKRSRRRRGKEMSSYLKKQERVKS